MRRRVLLAAAVVAAMWGVLFAAPSQADPTFNPFGWPVVSVGPGNHFIRKSGYLPVNPANQVSALCLIDDPRCDHWLLEVRDYQGAVPCVGIAADRATPSYNRPEDQKLQISVYRLTPGALATSELVAVSYDGTLLFWGDREMGLMAGTYAVAIGRGRTTENPPEGPVAYRVAFASVLVGPTGLGYPFEAPDDLLLCVPGAWAADTGAAVARRAVEPFVTTSTVPTVTSVPFPPETVPVTVPPVTVPPITVPPTTVPEPPSGTPGLRREITVRIPFLGELIVRVDVPAMGLPPDPQGPPPTVEIVAPPPTTPPTVPPVTLPPTTLPTVPPVTLPPTTLPTVPPTTLPPTTLPTVPPVTSPPTTLPEPPLLNPGRWPVVTLDADDPVQIRSSSTASIGLPCTPIWGDCDHTLLHVRGFDGSRPCVGISTRKAALVRHPYELQLTVHRIQPGLGVGEVVARSHDGTLLFAAEPGATYGVSVGRAQLDYYGAPFEYDAVLAAGDPALDLVERHPDASSCSPGSWVRDWFSAIGRALQAFLP